MGIIRLGTLPFYFARSKFQNFFNLLEKKSRYEWRGTTNDRSISYFENKCYTLLFIYWNKKELASNKL